MTTTITPSGGSIVNNDLSQRQAQYPEELRRVLLSTGVLKTETSTPLQQAGSNDDKMAVLLDPRFSQPPHPNFPAAPSTSHPTSLTQKIIQNKTILASNMERPISSTMVLVDRSTWHPPYTLPSSEVGVAPPHQQWHLKGSVNVAKGEMYVRFDGPLNAKRSFCLQFINILGTSKRHQTGSVWPPSDDMMDTCDDLSRWTISASVDPYKDIKATVVDPWDKAYLLTIPVKLLTKGQS